MTLKRCTVAAKMDKHTEKQLSISGGKVGPTRDRIWDIFGQRESAIQGI